MRSKAVKNIKLYLICIVLATLFAAIYSTTTTPLLSGRWGTDSAFFIIVGQGMGKGLLPYRDFFDMKGPYLFFLEFIGQKICIGRTGAFIIQCINLSVCLYIAARISDLFAKTFIRIHRFLCFLPMFLIAAVTFEGGNLTEEFCLPAILLSVYFCLKYFRDSGEKKSYKHPVLFSLYNGFAVGYICFIRITNAATIGAVLLTVFIFLLARKEIKNALINLLMVAAGFVAACGIPCVFFAAKNMLGEMLSQVFVFGVTYSSEISMGEKFVNVFTTFKLFLLLLLVPVITCFIYREKWYMKMLAISSCLLLLLAVTMGNAYMHYFTLLIPHIVMGFAIAYKNSGKYRGARRNKLFIVCMALVFLLNSVQFVKSTAKGAFTFYSCSLLSSGKTMADVPDWIKSMPGAEDNIFTGEVNEQALEIASHIPDAEKNSVYCFGDEYWSRWYGITGIMPSYKYMDWHLNYLELMPGLENEIATWIRTNGSTWIVTTNEEKPLSDEVFDAINENYEAEFANEAYTLYRRIS